MHHDHINKITDVMMQAAQTPGKGMTPGNPEVNTGGVGKVGSMAERYKNINFLGGFYKGKEAWGLESWNINEIDINAPQFMHMQQVVRATCGDKVGVGALEQYIVGPHTRYGMKGFLDPL